VTAILIYIWSLFPKIAIGPATVYWPGDGHCGDIRADGRRFKKDDSHIAHRKIPLGTIGYLCSLREKACTKTTVLDRGPFGAIRRGTGQYKVLVRGRKGWDYRGEFDITYRVAKAIKHRSWDVVIFFYGR
jgi:hypothetical protein